MTMSRLGARPTEVIDRSAKLRFRWNGKRFSGFEGDTVRLGAGRRRGARVLALHEVPPAPRHPHRRLLGSQPASAVGDDPNVRAGHRLLESGMDVRAQNVWPSLHRDIKAANGLVGRFLTAGFYYKTFMRPQRLWARLRAGAGNVCAGRQDRPGHAPPLPRQALHPSRRRGGRRRAGRDRGGSGRGLRRCPGDAGGAPARSGRPSALLQQRIGPRRAGRAASGTRRLRRGGSHRLNRHGPVRGQLARDRAAQPPRSRRAPHQGSGQGAGGCAGPDRETLRVLGQRPARSDHLGRGPSLDQPVGGQAGRAGGGVHGQLRGRRRRRRPRPGRGGGRRGDRRPRGPAHQRGPGRVEGGGGRGRGRDPHRGRPARRGRRLDRSHLAAQHGR